MIVTLFVHKCPTCITKPYISTYQLQHQQQYVHIQLFIFVLFGPVYLYPELKPCDRYNLLKVVLLLYIVTERNSNEEYKGARVHIAANAIISTSVYSIFSCAVKSNSITPGGSFSSVCVM